VRKTLQSISRTAGGRALRHPASWIIAALIAASLALVSPVTGAVSPAASSPNANVEQVRSEFEKLGLEMVGMTTFMGRPRRLSARSRANFRSDLMWAIQVGSYRIISIQNAYVIFERSGVQLWLPLGEREQLDADGEQDGSRTAAHKAAVSELKIKTRAYKTASVVPMNGFLPSARERTVASAGPITFRMPMKGTVTSQFGYRKRPKGGARRYHRGVDIAAPYGTPIKAAAAGRVTKVSRSWAKGLNIEIQHGNGYTTAYFPSAQGRGEARPAGCQGELIAYEGNSGNSTGPHLHFEIHKNGQPVNPALYVRELGRR
jgi:murein DD-endopeptidase MepM/ murein hydrolase activator NlpD